MDPFVMILALLGVVVVALGTGMWIFVGLLVASLFSLFVLLDFPVQRVGAITRPVMLKAIFSFELAAVPLFIWMGEIISRTQVSTLLFRGLQPWVSGLPGGLLHANVGGSVLFSAMSGSSVATTATVGRVTLRELAQRGYDQKLSLGSITVAGTIGIMIPPSITLIVYGLIAEVSVVQLFAAGVLPGLMLGVFYSSYIGARCLIDPSLTPARTERYSLSDKLRALGNLAPVAFLVTLMLGVLYSSYIAARCLIDPSLTPARSERYSLTEKLRALGNLAPVAFLVTLMLGSIYGGYATPSEAAAVGVLGALIIAMISGGISAAKLYQTAMGAVRITAMIGSAFAAAAVLASAIGFLRLPMHVSLAISALDLSPYMLLLMLTIIYILLGCVLDGISMILMTVPITLPLLLMAGFDPVWVGVYMVLIVEIGMVTPPIGFNLFVLRGIVGVSIGRIAMATLPFFLIMLLGGLLLVLFPQIALWLPQVLR